MLIPEPTPHLKLFLVTLTTIHPYESIRIRLPPEPPPPKNRPLSNDRRSNKTLPTVITSYLILYEVLFHPLPRALITSSVAQSNVKFRLSSKMLRSA